MDVRPLHTEDDYNWALAEIEVYFRDPPTQGSPWSDRFEVLATLVEAYEAKNWPITLADPVEVLNHVIEGRRHGQADLAEILGSRSHASEVLARKRPLSLEMIRRISEAWDVPAHLLIGRYADAASSSHREAATRPPNRQRQSKPIQR